MRAFPARQISYLLLFAMGCGLITTSCSFVNFEKSAYAPRGVDLVYSEQEDITFLVWRLGPSVDFDRVEFELHIDGQYQRIDLADAPFPHDPYGCDRIYQCVQFQIRGRWLPPTDVAPLRAVDSRHGIFDATQMRVHDVVTTLSIDPLAIDNNTAAQAQLTDWFDEEEIPLRRDFEWTLVQWNSEESESCPQADGADWSTLSSRVSLPQDWTNSTPCFVVRPRRNDLPGTQVAAPLIAGPVLFAEEVAKTVPDKKHPTLIAFLVDLQVVNQGRCDRIINTIEETVVARLSSRGYPHRNLGVFRPIGADNREDSGCEQIGQSHYPFDEIEEEARRQAASFQEDPALVLVYLNNVELPPSESKLEAMEHYFQSSQMEQDFHLFTWAIASNVINSIFPWDNSTPWAPLEDENFLPFLENIVAYHFPLRSTDMGWDTPLVLPPSNRADSPEHFRLCSVSPALHRIRLPPGWPFSGPAVGDWPWPQEGDPELFLRIGAQDFVPYQDYRRDRISVVYEICDDFCDNPFVGPDGRSYHSWLNAFGVCQWY